MTRQFIFLIFILSFTLFSSTAKSANVELAYAQSSEVKQALDLSGTIKAVNQSDLPPLEAGVVADILVESGDIVKAGDILAKLNAELAQARLEQFAAGEVAANIAFEEADRLLGEVIALSKQQVVAKTLISERRANKAIAEANYKKAKAEHNAQKVIVARHNIIAPFDGVITHRYIDLGEWVTAQTPAFKLISEQNLRLELSVPQEYYGYFIKNDHIKASVKSDIKAAVPLETVVTKVIKSTNELSRTFKIHVDLPQTISLVNGSSARAFIEFANLEQAQKWIPQSALKHHPDGGYSVFTVSNDIAKRHIVNVHQNEGTKVAVSGLPNDLPVVSKGVALLSDGDKVSVTSLNGGN